MNNTYATKDDEVNWKIDENDFDIDTDRKLGLQIRGVTVSCLWWKCEVPTVISWRRWWKLPRMKVKVRWKWKCSGKTVISSLKWKWKWSPKKQKKFRKLVELPGNYADIWCHKLSKKWYLPQICFLCLIVMQHTKHANDLITIWIISKFQVRAHLGG